MGGSIADLKTMMNDTITKFNAGDLAGVNANLANGVDVTSLRPQVKTTGLAAVASLNNQQTVENSNFKLMGDRVFPPPKAVADKAHISGKATWTDTNNPAGETIKFDFDCVFDGGRWLFQTVKGGIAPA